jgi:hypothetical protein
MQGLLQIEKGHREISDTWGVTQRCGCACINLSLSLSLCLSAVHSLTLTHALTRPRALSLLVCVGWGGVGGGRTDAAGASPLWSALCLRQTDIAEQLVNTGTHTHTQIERERRTIAHTPMHTHMHTHTHRHTHRHTPMYIHVHSVTLLLILSVYLYVVWVQARMWRRPMRVRA